MAEGMTFGPERDMSAQARADIAERLDRIEQTLKDPKPDTTLILHDLKQLDIAAEAAGDDGAKRRAAELRNELIERFGD